LNDYSYWIALTQTPGISSATLVKIHDALNSTGLSIRDICELTEKELQSEFSFSDSTNKAIVASHDIFESVESIYHDILEAKIEPILFFEESYPHQLRVKMPSSFPPVLYSIGNNKIIRYRNAAILSSSEISSKAESICYQSSRICSEHFISVAGGLNKNSGTLIAAGAFENGGNYTGVIPCGMLSYNLSQRLQGLFDEDKHCIFSPFFPTAGISKFNAEYRNQCLVSISKAVYIIEINENDDVLQKTARFIVKNEIPLYTTEYSDFPETAIGNKKLITELSARTVRGRKSGNKLTPNLDAFAAHMKFDVS
jgi:predicted Rossmann fold nucleotide-binding protein DprA/Smf involved in DNA uptake